MMSRIKLDRPDDSSGVAPDSDSNEFICLYHLLRSTLRSGLYGMRASYGLYIELEEHRERNQQLSSRICLVRTSASVLVGGLCAVDLGSNGWEAGIRTPISRVRG